MFFQGDILHLRLTQGEQKGAPEGTQKKSAGIVMSSCPVRGETGTVCVIICLSIYVSFHHFHSCSIYSQKMPEANTPHLEIPLLPQFRQHLSFLHQLPVTWLRNPGFGLSIVPAAVLQMLHLATATIFRSLWGFVWLKMWLGTTKNWNQPIFP